MSLTLIRDAATESGSTILAGQIVKYLGHVVGGMVQVEYNGKEEIIHPANTKELS